MKLVLIGDVRSADGFHAGDGAMVEAAVDHLRRRGADEVVVLPKVGVPGREALVSDLVRDRYLDHSTPEAASLRPVAEQVASSDGLVVCGGGNLNSVWPGHLYDRAALVGMARAAGVPVVVTGQTLGPLLTARHRAVLAELLAGAGYVGVRERASVQVAHELVPDHRGVRLTLDDAAFAEPGPVAERGRYVALTVDPDGDGSGEAWGERIARFVALARELHLISGLPVRFVPHVGVIGDDATGDVAVGMELRERLGESWFEVAPLGPVADLVAEAAGAAAVVSTRYHPLVFALSAGVPCLGITADAYTSVKVRGALAHAGLDGWALPTEAVATGVVAELFDELWSRRQEIGKHLDAHVPTWRDAAARHWDQVWETLRGRPLEEAVPDPAPTVLAPELPGLAALQATVDALQRQAAEADLRWRGSFAEAEGYAQVLRDVVAARETEIDGLTALVAEQAGLADRVRDAEGSAEAARRLAADVRRRSDEAFADVERLTRELAEAEAEAARHREHVEILYATRTMRWTAGARSVWQRIRRRG